MAAKPKLMISYCHANKKKAQEILAQFDPQFEILIDENYFELSRSTKPEMKRMVGDADVVLVLLSPDSVKSSAVRYEVSCALARESEEQRTVLFAGMIEPCKPMPEWDSTRLYANLHTGFAKQFPKLKRSLLKAAGKALPRATAIPDSEALIELLKHSFASMGFNARGEVEMISRRSDRPDNPLSATMFNLDGVKHFSVFVATCLKWSCFFYVPKQAIAGRSERTFAHERFGVRSQIGARFGGYLANPDRRTSDSAETEKLIRLFRRFPQQIDVIISPYSVATSYVRKFDVKTLSWPGTRAVVFYRTDGPDAGIATLPLFVGGAITNRETLSDALRALRAALRLELRTHGAVPEKWGFLSDGAFSKGTRRFRAARTRPRAK